MHHIPSVPEWERLVAEAENTLDDDQLERLLLIERQVRAWAEMSCEERRAVQEWEAERSAPQKSDRRKRGVSLNDVALLLEDGDQMAATRLVAFWSDSKKQLPKALGKCPIDGRRTLSTLDEMVAFLERNYAFKEAKLSTMQSYLVSRLRLPIKKPRS